MVPADISDVSRETFADLKKFEALVLKWTKAINLVSARDKDAVWSRHIIDSVQVYKNAPPNGNWLDVGSGGGFPGIVAAILSKGQRGLHKFTLVDSDQRKCTFLRTVVRELDLGVTVIDGRIDELEPFQSDILTARALGDLEMLLGFAERHLKRDGIAIFPKGASWGSENDRARQQWSYNLEVVQSTTNADAAILKIKEISRV